MSGNSRVDVAKQAVQTGTTFTVPSNLRVKQASQSVSEEETEEEDPVGWSEDDLDLYDCLFVNSFYFNFNSQSWSSELYNIQKL